MKVATLLLRHLDCSVGVYTHTGAEGWHFVGWSVGIVGMHSA